MKLKTYARHQMNFKSAWVQPTAILMGLSFYLRVFHYFGFTYLSQWTFWDIVFQIIFPLGICGAFVVFFGAMKRNAPGLYGLLGAGLCLLTAVWNLFGAGWLRCLLAFLFYPIVGVALLGVSGGYLPWKRLPTVLLGAAAVIRVLLIRVPALGLGGLVLEASVLCAIASLFCLNFCIVEVKQK